MERVPRQQYTTEFREQAVRLVLEQKLPILEAARRLSMSGNTLKNLGGASPARPACDSGREPTTRDRAGSGVVPAHTRSCRSADGAGHFKKTTAYVAKAQLPGTR